MSRRALRIGAWPLAFAAAAACRPELGTRESLVTATQVLAVRGDPPEAKPGEMVRYTLLVATPDGPMVTPPASWAYCATPKLLTENGAASAACLGTGVRQLADGASAIEAAIPTDACSLFGPEITSADLRPRDPDITGGYYQPLRVTVAGKEDRSVAFGLERLSCKLANAAAEVTTEFGSRYVANANPELAPLTATRDGVPVALDDVPRGARLVLHAAWRAGDAESYVVYDMATRAVVTRRESMRLSWFTTAGTFESDRTGRSEDEAESFTENAWTAPDEARVVHLWTVLRDTRGGSSFASSVIVVR